MTAIRVPEHTAFDDVIAWDLRASDAIRVTKRSGFEPGVQGLALAALAAIKPGSSTLALDCDFEEPQSEEEVTRTFFSTAFGFALARLVRHISFAGKPASSSFKPLLSNVYKSKRGVLGIGPVRSVVCADPVFPLPPALALTGAASSSEFYPPPSVFASFLNSVVENMGFRRLLASSEELGVTSFVYEALRNSLEHGLATESTRRARSTRAIVVEKIVLQGSDIATRRLSPELKAYLERFDETNREDLGLGVICFTVADQGDSIQGTLPAKQGETAQSRLVRAFAPGESRKPKGVISRGRGLPNIVSAAHHLRALVRITSGNLVLGQDFSLTESKYPKLDFQEVKEIPDNFVCGTCVSIFFPEYSFDLDQKPLFGRR